MNCQTARHEFTDLGPIAAVTTELTQMRESPIKPSRLLVRNPPSSSEAAEKAFATLLPRCGVGRSVAIIHPITVAKSPWSIHAAFERP